MRKQVYLLVLIVLVLLLQGCSAPTPAATPTPTRTPVVEPTLLILPTATPTIAPTATPTLPVEQTPASAEVTPYPPNVNPLTGLQVADPTMLDHSPLAIKISNSVEVRPQAGLNSADLVFEHYAEGGITRLTAVFYATYPERVGSVRSGRLIDLEIPAMYQASFSYSGSSAGVKEKYRNSDLFPERIISPDFGVGAPYFYRVPREGLAFEHTLFASPTDLRALAVQRGIDKRPDFTRLMAFNATVPSGKDVYDATQVKINYRADICRVRWDYDVALGNWLRTSAGEAHRDALTGEQLRAANVILLFANHLETDILEDTWGGGHMSIEIQVWGQGQALIFRDGKMIQGYWKREAREHMLTFWDGEGKPLALKPGNTWMQLAPLETTGGQPSPGIYDFTP